MLKIGCGLCIVVLLASGFSYSNCLAADVCALTIEIVGNKGEPTIARVLVTDAWSRLVADTQTDSEGKATVCDLGFSEQRVLITTRFCSSIFIDKVRFVYPHPLHFRLELPSCSVPEEGAVVGTACAVYFRIQGEDEKSVGAATLKFGWSPGLEKKADSFGRLRGAIPVGDTGSLVTAVAPGFEPTQVQVRCRGQMYREELIVMRRKK